MLRLSRGIWPLLATLVLVATMVGLGSTPASAHATEVNHGNDYAVTSASHKSGYVCDREADGHVVVAEWYDAGTDIIIGTVSDTTDAGCSGRISFDGRMAAKVRVCELDTGKEWCTDKHWT